MQTDKIYYTILLVANAIVVTITWVRAMQIKNRNIDLQNELEKANFIKDSVMKRNDILIKENVALRNDPRLGSVNEN